MNKIKLLAFAILYYCCDFHSQGQVLHRLTLSGENIIELNFCNTYIEGVQEFYPVGFLQDDLVLKRYDDKKNSYVFSYNENLGLINKIESGVVFTNKLSNYKIFDDARYFQKAFLENFDDDGYTRSYVLNNDVRISIDSIYNCDKKIHVSISSDGKYLLQNSFNTLYEMYNPAQDDHIKMYDIKELKNGNIIDTIIPCFHCSKPFLVNDFFFFEKAFKPDDWFGGFSNTHIYRSPFDNIDDTTRIASLSNILAVSPDGKFILGTRFRDRPNTPCAIFDVENKKYQLLLGRDYSSMPAFYSKVKEKFAFCYIGYIIYIDFPTEYPFDALRENNPDIPNWSDHEFYEQFVHPPLKHDK